MEAELYAVVEGHKDSKMLLNLLEDAFNIKANSSMLYCDNKAAIVSAHGDGNRRKTRHLDLRYQYIMKQLSDDQTTIEYIQSEQNKADGLTKILGNNKITKSAKDLGLHPQPTC